MEWCSLFGDKAVTQKLSPHSGAFMEQLQTWRLVCLLGGQQCGAWCGGKCVSQNLFGHH